MQNNSLDNEIISFSAKLAALGFNAPDAIEGFGKDIVGVIGFQLQSTISDPNKRKQVIENYRNELLEKAGL